MNAKNSLNAVSLPLRILMDNKLLALQKHLIAVKNQISNPSKKHTTKRLPAFKQWAELEIKRTETAIEKLKV